jgi:C4-dicarboxylate transporter DctQ subunit
MSTTEESNETTTFQEVENPRSILDQWIISGGPYVSLLFLFSGIIIVIEIFLRYVFNSPTIWVHETTVFICALCFAYGGCYCLARDKHIRIVLIYDNVSPIWRRRLDIFISITGIIFGATLTWAAWTLTEKAMFAPWGDFRMETSGSAWNPPYPALSKTFLFIIFIVMTLQFVLHLAHYLKDKKDV